MGILLLLVSGVVALLSHFLGGPTWVTIIASVVFALLLILYIIALSKRGTRSYGGYSSSDTGSFFHDFDLFTDIGSSSADSDCGGSADGGGDCGGD